jgi:hypothetical protein
MDARRGRATGTTLWLLALAVVVSGCGGGPSADRPTPSVASSQERRDVDPCTLPTDPELAAILAGTPQPPQRLDNNAVNQCTWTDVERQRTVAVQLLNPVIPKAPDGYGWTREFFDKVWGQNAEPVTGLGDAAWFKAETARGTVFVRTGEFAFAVALVYADVALRPQADDELLGTIRPLATAIAGRTS